MQLSVLRTDFSHYSLNMQMFVLDGTGCMCLSAWTHQVILYGVGHWVRRWILWDGFLAVQSCLQKLEVADPFYFEAEDTLLSKHHLKNVIAVLIVNI